MKNLFLFTVGILLSLSASSQIFKPVVWSYAAKKTSATTATVFIKATLHNGWHIYAQAAQEGGPVKTTFAFTPDKAFKLYGKVAEPKPVTKYEKAFGTNVSYFENEVIFQQKIKLNADGTTVKGTVEFMVCSDRQCLPPETIAFAVPVS